MDLAVSDLGGLFCSKNVLIFFSIIQNFENFYLFVNLHHSKTLFKGFTTMSYLSSGFPSDLTPAKYNVNVSNFPKFSRKKTEQNLSRNKILNILQI